MLLRDSSETAEKFALALLPGSDFESLRDWVTTGFSEPIEVDFESLDFSASVKTFEKQVSAPDGKTCSLKELYARRLRYQDYMRSFCEHFQMPDIDHEKLLTQLQKKVPPIYEYLWGLIV